MSRCFPFPPPGYVKIGARGGDGAIEMESIKLQKEKKRAEKEQKKEKKRLKKEKKEQLKKQIEASCVNTAKFNDTKSLPDIGGRRDSSAFVGRALSDDSTKSGLSEEHELPLPSNFFDLSDGNDSTKKRKRADPVPPSSERYGNLKLSFSFKRLNASESSIDAPLSASVVQNHSASQPLLTRRDEQRTRCSTNQAQPLPNELSTTTGRDSKSVPDGADVKPPYSSHKRKSSSCSKHRSLFEEWCPLPLLREESEEESCDQEWLFGAKQRGAKVARKGMISDALTMCRGEYQYNSFPRADYIPEAEIYVLPFTLPF